MDKYHDDLCNHNEFSVFSSGDNVPKNEANNPKENAPSKWRNDTSTYLVISL